MRLCDGGRSKFMHVSASRNGGARLLACPVLVLVSVLVLVPVRVLVSNRYGGAGGTRSGGGPRGLKLNYMSITTSRKQTIKPRSNSQRVRPYRLRRLLDEME